VNGFEALAGAISDLADSAEDAVAGGAPPAYVVQQATERAKQIAWAATMAARGRITPDDLGGYLGRDQGDGETLMLGHPRRKAEPSGRHRNRPWQSLRQWLARAWAGPGG
jgi:hypothetical protein